MIGDLIAAGKAILDLSKAKSEQDARIFAEYVKTTYEKMQQIHRDYLSAFATIPRLTEQEFKQTDLIDFLREKRVEFEPIRSEMFGLTAEIHEFNKYHRSAEELDLFFFHIGLYFDFACRGTTSTAYTYLEEVIESWDQQNLETEKKRAKLREVVDEIQLILRGRFDLISKAYADLKTKLVV